MNEHYRAIEQDAIVKRMLSRSPPMRKTDTYYENRLKHDLKEKLPRGEK